MEKLAVEKTLIVGIIEILINKGLLTEEEGMKAKQLVANDSGWRM